MTHKYELLRQGTYQDKAVGDLEQEYQHYLENCCDDQAMPYPFHEWKAWKEEQLPTFSDLYGMAPDATKGVPAEEFINNIRNGKVTFTDDDIEAYKQMAKAHYPKPGSVMDCLGALEITLKGDHMALYMLKQVRQALEAQIDPYRQTEQEPFDCQLEDREKGLTDDHKAALGMVTQMAETD